MSTSVLVNGIGLLEPPTRSRSSVSAGGSLCRNPAEPLPPVLHDHRGHHDREEWPRTQAQCDGIPDLQRPAPAARGPSPAQLLLGEVHPERRDDHGEDQDEEPQTDAEHDCRGPGPLEGLDGRLHPLLQLDQPLRNPHALPILANSRLIIARALSRTVSGPGYPTGLVNPFTRAPTAKLPRRCHGWRTRGRGSRATGARLVVGAGPGISGRDGVLRLAMRVSTGA